MENSLRVEMTAEVAKITPKQYVKSIMALPSASWKPAFLVWNNPISIAVTPTGPGGRAKTIPTKNPKSIDKSN